MFFTNQCGKSAVLGRAVFFMRVDLYLTVGDPEVDGRAREDR